MIELSGPSLAPAAGGKPRQIVVLLHGYGSNGEDLIGLAPDLAAALPEAIFLSPNAPFPSEVNPWGGYQWFGLMDINPAMMLGALRLAAQILDDYLDRALAEFGLDESALALLGFSQGAMMALHVGPRRTRAPAAVLGYSGRLIAPELLAEEARVKPDILLVHGAMDPVVPFAALAEAEAHLTQAGMQVETLARPHLAHGIDGAGIAKGRDFLRRLRRRS